MRGFLDRNKVHQTDVEGDENMAYNIYLCNYYKKDFKYISPEVLNSLKKNRLNFREDDKPMFQKWLEQVLKGLKQFFYGGSLHGVKYIFEPTFSVREKVTWVVIIAISVVVCAINIIQLMSKWSTSPFVNVIDSVPSPVWAIPFPMVVLCPHLHVKLAYYNVSQMNDTSPFVNVIDSVPSPVWAIPFPMVVLCPHLHVKLAYYNVSQMNDVEQFFAALVCPRMMNTKRMDRRLDGQQMNLLLNFITEASPACEDVIKSCNWPEMHAQKWQSERCCDLFQPIFTNYGLCYAFNSLPLNGMSNGTLSWQKSFNKQAKPASLKWGLDMGYPKTFPPDPNLTPLRAMASGETNGLGLELYLNTSDHQFACDGNSLGFTVLVSSPTDHVYTSTVIRLPMNRMTTVEVYPLTYKTDPGLRALTPAQRQCFFQDERQLEFFEFYTDSNCKHDLLIQKARNMCDCAPFNWPKKNKRDPICSTNSEYDCVNKAKAQVEEQLIYAYYEESDEQATKEESQSCHPSCNDVIYSSQVFYSDLTEDLDSSRQWGQPKVGEVTQINVHFYDDMFLGQHRHAQYDHYYFVGAIGGLLSLFLGFSIISVAELVYFVILRPAYEVIKDAYYKT